MNHRSQISVIILAAGSGKRMSSPKTKQTMEIFGKSILQRCVEVFEKCSLVSDITVVAKEDEIGFAEAVLSHCVKVKNVIIGGKCRAESAIIGFKSLENKSGIVMIHDACRCLITEKEIRDVANCAAEVGAATASLPIRDTIKKCDPDKNIIKTVPRENLYAVSTPQAFKYEIYKRAAEACPFPDESITDDNMLVENIGVSIRCVETLATNIKITVPEDIELAEFIITKRGDENG